MACTILYHVVVILGSCTLVRAFWKLVEWVDAPPKKRRHTAR